MVIFHKMVIAKKEERIYNSNRNKYRKIYLLHNNTKGEKQ